MADDFKWHEGGFTGKSVRFALSEELADSRKWLDRIQTPRTQS